jgi:hypothetical protein
LVGLKNIIAYIEIASYLSITDYILCQSELVEDLVMRISLRQAQTDTFYKCQRSLKYAGFKTRNNVIRNTYASIRAYFAFFSINSRRGATSSPMSILKVWSHSAAFSIVARRRVRVAGFMVVSHNCTSFISPKPL